MSSSLVNPHGDSPIAGDSAGTIAAQLIREAIITGRIGSGSRLRELALASELGVSRTPIREALRDLEKEGLVELVPNRGAVVRSYQSHDVEEIYELRAVLEGLAARRAADQATSDAVSSLRMSCERFRTAHRADDILAMVNENLVFHTSIHRMASRGRLESIIRNLLLPFAHKVFSLTSRTHREQAERHHRRITDAIAARDSDRAELVMREHIFDSREFLLAVLPASSLSVASTVSVAAGLPHTQIRDEPPNYTE